MKTERALLDKERKVLNAALHNKQRSLRPTRNALLVWLLATVLLGGLLRFLFRPDLSPFDWGIIAVMAIGIPAWIFIEILVKRSREVKALRSFWRRID